MEVQRVVIFNPWTQNIYMVKTEKYNFSFKFTSKQFVQMNEFFKKLNKGGGNRIQMVLILFGGKK